MVLAKDVLLEKKKKRWIFKSPTRQEHEQASKKITHSFMNSTSSGNNIIFFKATIETCLFVELEPTVIIIF